MRICIPTKYGLHHFRDPKDEDFTQQTNEVVSTDYLGDGGSDM